MEYLAAIGSDAPPETAADLRIPSTWCFSDWQLGSDWFGLVRFGSAWFGSEARFGNEFSKLAPQLRVIQTASLGGNLKLEAI